MDIVQRAEKQKMQIEIVEKGGLPGKETINTGQELQINEAELQRLIDYINKGIEIYVEQVNKAVDFLSKVLPGLIETLQEVLPVLIKTLQNAVKNLNAKRKKWLVEKQVKPIEIFLDKRSKIHRCRNAC